MRVRLIPWVVAAAALLFAVAAQSAAAASPLTFNEPAAVRPSGQLGPPRFAALPLRGVSTAALQAEIAAGTTIKTWTSSIKSSLGGTYSYTMVGKNPLKKQKKPAANISAVVIPLKMVFEPSATTFDPKANSTCLANHSNADSLLTASPIYNNHSYTVGGTKIGNVQYEASVQREEFAKYTLGKKAINKRYNVNLSPVDNAPEVTVNISGGVVATGGCDGHYGEIDISSFDNFVRTTLIPNLSSEISPKQFPMFLLYDVVLTNGGCCIIGYHSAYPNPAHGSAVQTYSVTDYPTPGFFTNANIKDIYPASHEVGEWMNDPYVNNSTPLWGHIGQVTGCQSNLEVGDPLTGTPFVPISMPNGVTYSAQELAFRDWFYRTKSVGLHGWFSSQGTFKSNAGPVC